MTSIFPSSSMKYHVMCLGILIDNLFVPNQTFRLCNSLLSVVIISCILLSSISNVVSPANNNYRNSSFVTFGRSLIYIINNKGPNMDTCGIPHVTDFVRDSLFSVGQVTFKPF